MVSGSGIERQRGLMTIGSPLALKGVVGELRM